LPDFVEVRGRPTRHQLLWGALFSFGGMQNSTPVE
jgi:hypothetical protein